MKVVASDLWRACRALRAERLVAVAVHENPDYDALGAAVGLIDLLGQLGAQAHLYLDPGVRLPALDDSVPAHYIRYGLPPATASLYALDTGSFARMALAVDRWSARVVNIDHHPDNARFGDINLVRPAAASTSEIVCDVAACLDLRPSPVAAAALYAGISFDSGHFRHPSTSVHTLLCASDLVHLGADPNLVYHQLYENKTLAALKLWAHAINNAVAIGDQRAVVSVLTRADYQSAGADADDTEGIVDALRAAQGVDVAALVKEQMEGARVRVSLRSHDFDVNSVAALRGGGGHRNAAGFSSDDDPREVAQWLSSVLAERLQTASS